MRAARPRFFASLPHPVQALVTYRCIRPAVAAWLNTRVAKAHVTASTEVTRTAVVRNGLSLELSDGATRFVDHLLLATGYRIDISKYSFIDPGLLKSISRMQGYPLLSHQFRSSVPGLFFAGATAVLSLGPLFRFVVGTQYCARAISEAIAPKSELVLRREHAFA